jgi:uncharacterized protein DUF4412
VALSILNRGQIKKGNSMIRFISSAEAARPVIILTLLVIATLGLACKGTLSGAKTFEGEITSKMYMGDSHSEIRTAIKGSRTRTESEITLPQMSLGGSNQSFTTKSVVIMDLSSMTMTMLDPQAKTYMSINAGEKVAEMPKDAASIPVPKVTSTGKTETIAGYTCKHWMFDDKMDMCMAQGLGNFSDGASGGVLDRLKAMTNTQLQANREFAEFAEGGAYPLKTAVLENGQWKTIMEVSNIERKSLDDSLFTVPADYKKTELPEIPGMSGVKR